MSLLSMSKKEVWVGLDIGIGVLGIEFEGGALRNR